MSYRSRHTKGPRLPSINLVEKVLDRIQERNTFDLNLINEMADLLNRFASFEPRLMANQDVRVEMHDYCVVAEGLVRRIQQE